MLYKLLKIFVVSNHFLSSAVFILSIFFIVVHTVTYSCMFNFFLSLLIIKINSQRIYSHSQYYKNIMLYTRVLVNVTKLFEIFKLKKNKPGEPSMFTYL